MNCSRCKELRKGLIKAVAWLRRIEQEYPGCLNDDAINKHLQQVLDEADSPDSGIIDELRGVCKDMLEQLEAYAERGWSTYGQPSLRIGVIDDMARARAVLAKFPKEKA